MAFSCIFLVNGGLFGSTTKAADQFLRVAARLVPAIYILADNFVALAAKFIRASTYIELMLSL